MSLLRSSSPLQPRLGARPRLAWLGPGSQQQLASAGLHKCTLCFVCPPSVLACKHNTSWLLAATCPPDCPPDCPLDRFPQPGSSQPLPCCLAHLCGPPPPAHLLTPACPPPPGQVQHKDNHQDNQDNQDPPGVCLGGGVGGQGGAAGSTLTVHAKGRCRQYAGGTCEGCHSTVQAVHVWKPLVDPPPSSSSK